MINLLFYHTPLFYLIQSVWRDEAFSFFLSQRNPLEIIKYTSNDFNPPLYYLFLYLWSFVTGKQEILLRLLSLAAHIGTTVFSWKFARKLYTRRFAIVVAVLFFFNPMLLYYAFEMRMYALYAFFALASTYFFYTRNWRYYTVVTVFGLYTHSYFPLILFSFVVYSILIGTYDWKSLRRILLPAAFYLPWIPVIVSQFLHSKESWIFPVEKEQVQSVIGNLFVNYEGTPDKKWDEMAKLSLLLGVSTMPALFSRKKLLMFFLLPVVLSLTLILGYSLSFRPLYVNRYLIFITVFEILALSLGIWSIRQLYIRSAVASLWFAFVIYMNIWMVPHHTKADFKSTFAQINSLAQGDDYVYSTTPLGFLESAYYYTHPDHVFIYNPEDMPVPDFVGAILVFPDASRTSLPPAPARVFMVNDDASYALHIRQ